MKEMKKIVISRLQQFGTFDNASKIKPINLDIMANKYKNGDLLPKISN